MSALEFLGRLLMLGWGEELPMGLRSVQQQGVREAADQGRPPWEGLLALTTTEELSPAELVTRLAEASVGALTAEGVESCAAGVRFSAGGRPYEGEPWSELNAALDDAGQGLRFVELPSGGVVLGRPPAVAAAIEQGIFPGAEGLDPSSLRGLDTEIAAPRPSPKPSSVEPADVSDPYSEVDVKRSFAALCSALEAEGGAQREILERRLQLAAFAGHGPATRALKAAGLERPTAPRDGQRWFSALSDFGRVVQLRAGLVAVLQVLPHWTEAAGDPHAAASAVLSWFAAVSRRSKPRHTRVGLDAWLDTPAGPLELACHEASERCARLALDPPGKTSPEQFLNRCIAEAAGKVAKCAWAYSQGVGSERGTLLQAFGFASIPLGPGTGKGESRAAVANANARLAYAALRTAVKPGLLAFALSPSFWGDAEP